MSLMASTENNGPGGFDVLFAKNVPHILEKIFFSLDYESYKNCLEVNDYWNELLTSKQYRRIAKSIFREDTLEDEKKLLRAAEKRNFKEVRRLIASQLVDGNYAGIDREGTTLMIAAYEGNIEVVKLLLDAGAEPQLANKHRVTPLNEAARNGHWDIVKLLLERGAEINHRTDIVHSALQYAAIYGDKDMVEYLLDRGAQIEITDEWRQGPLHWAAMKRHVQVVKILLKREADLMTMRMLLLFGVGKMWPYF